MIHKRPRTVFASAAVAPIAEEESCAEKLKKAVEKKSGRKQHDEYVKREHEHYEKQ